MMAKLVRNLLHSRSATSEDLSRGPQGTVPSLICPTLLGGISWVILESVLLGKMVFNFFLPRVAPPMHLQKSTSKPSRTLLLSAASSSTLLACSFKKLSWSQQPFIYLLKEVFLENKKAELRTCSRQGFPSTSQYSSINSLSQLEITSVVYLKIALHRWLQLMSSHFTE